MYLKFCGNRVTFLFLISLKIVGASFDEEGKSGYEIDGIENSFGTFIHKKYKKDKLSSLFFVHLTSSCPLVDHLVVQ